MASQSVRTAVFEPAILIVVDPPLEGVFAVTVLSRQFRLLSLQTPVLLDPKTIVKLRFKDSQTWQATVTYCKCVEAGEYNVGIELKGGMERRKEPRFPFADSIRLTILSSEEPPSTISGQARDISRSGLCIVSSDMVPPGHCVEVRLTKSLISGVVRSCVPSPDGFRIGIAVTEVVGPVPQGDC